MKRDTVVLACAGLIGGALATLALHEIRSARANVPAKTSRLFYSGQLLDGAGAMTGAHDVEVQFFTTAVNGTQLVCPKMNASSDPTTGQYRVDVSPCNDALEASDNVFVQLIVDGSTFLPPAPKPRPQLGAVPFAVQSEQVTGPVAATQVVGDVPGPSGTIVMTAASSCPAHSIPADGSPLLQSGGTACGGGSCAQLFAAIGTTYGSTDATHFNVPDARGLFMRGAGSQTISGVTYTGTQGTTERDQFQSHRHSISDPGHAHQYGSSASVGNPVQGVATTANNAGGLLSSVEQTNITVTSPSMDGSNGSPRAGTETHPANIAVKVCIWF